jgi:hypothetical protein
MLPAHDFFFISILNPLTVEFLEVPSLLPSPQFNWRRYLHIWDTDRFLYSRHTNGVIVSGPILLAGRSIEHQLYLGNIDKVTDWNIQLHHAAGQRT